jgi:hypothetical protein
MSVTLRALALSAAFAYGFYAGAQIQFMTCRGVHALPWLACEARQ